jgi:hypothetical protein
MDDGAAAGAGADDGATDTVDGRCAGEPPDEQPPVRSNAATTMPGPASAASDLLLTSRDDRFIDLRRGEGTTITKVYGTG